MTCIVAVKKDNEVYIGSDSLVVQGMEKIKNVRKLTTFPGFVVGVAGEYKLHHILEEMDKKKVEPILTIKDARDFAKEVFSRLKSDSEFDDLEDIKECSMLIATSTNIYEIGSSFDCVDCASFGGVGTGAGPAKAVIKLILDFKLMEDPRSILGAAIEIASDIDLHCSMPAYISKVEPVKKRQTPKRKRK